MDTNTSDNGCELYTSGNEESSPGLRYFDGSLIRSPVFTLEIHPLMQEHERVFFEKAVLKSIVDRSFERAKGGDARGISIVRKATFAKRKLAEGKPWDSVPR